MRTMGRGIFRTNEKESFKTKERNLVMIASINPALGLRTHNSLLAFDFKCLRDRLFGNASGN